jgi:cysteine-rich repeat protein
VPDSSEPTTVALFCVPPTASTSINAAGGIPGPGAITFKSAIISYRCGNGVTEGIEECDDGNNANGDGCNEICWVE